MFYFYYTDWWCECNKRSIKSCFRQDKRSRQTSEATHQKSGYQWGTPALKKGSLLLQTHSGFFFSAKPMVTFLILWIAYIVRSSATHWLKLFNRLGLKLIRPCGLWDCRDDQLTLYTVTSICNFFILFSIHFPRCWQGEMVLTINSFFSWWLFPLFPD